MPALDKILLQRVQRSYYLLGAMREALRDLERQDLMEMLDLAIRDTKEAETACRNATAERRQKRLLRIHLGLRDLASLGGAEARGIALKVAREIPGRPRQND